MVDKRRSDLARQQHVPQGSRAARESSPVGSRGQRSASTQADAPSSADDDLLLSELPGSNSRPLRVSPHAAADDDEMTIDDRAARIRRDRLRAAIKRERGSRVRTEAHVEELRQLLRAQEMEKIEMQRELVRTEAAVSKAHAEAGDVDAELQSALQRLHQAKLRTQGMGSSSA